MFIIFAPSIQGVFPELSLTFGNACNVGMNVATFIETGSNKSRARNSNYNWLCWLTKMEYSRE